MSYICAYWTETGAWSTDGCSKQDSNASRTICTCNHLSSFAVLMALHPIEVRNSLRKCNHVRFKTSSVTLTPNLTLYLDKKQKQILMHVSLKFFLSPNSQDMGEQM